MVSSHRRTCRRISDDVRARVFALRDEGLTQWMIAEQLSIAESTVTRILKPSKIDDVVGTTLAAHRAARVAAFVARQADKL